MCECKVYRMRVGVEPQCVCEDSGVRIYVSAVQSRSKEARQQERDRRREAHSRMERMRKKCRRRVFMKKAKRIARALPAVLYRIMIAWIFSFEVMTLAGAYCFQYRGHEALGGEVFLAPAAFIAMYWIAGVALSAAPDAVGKEGGR